MVPGCTEHTEVVTRLSEVAGQMQRPGCSVVAPWHHMTVREERSQEQY